MMIYVYRVSDREYGAGFGEQGCKARGEIIERWPINTPEDAQFVARHGTAYWKASEKVSKLADIAHKLLTVDPTFIEEPEKQRIVVVETEKHSKPRKSWLSWFKTAGETT
jgi:hypothetical protein